MVSNRSVTGQQLNGVRVAQEKQGRTVPRPRTSLTPGTPVPKLKLMEVHLTPDQEAFVRQAVESGRLRSEQDAIQEALSLWEERERRRSEILAAVDFAERSFGRGEGRVITEDSVRQIAADIKRQGRARLASRHD